MGRFYHGDIEGKFWVAVQSSTDADFFGVEGEVSHVNYYFHEGDIPKIKSGIDECKEELGEYKKLLDDFFEGRDTYNDEMVANHFNENVSNSRRHTVDHAKLFVKWYARLELGEKILKCVEEETECRFEAEL